ncbi:MAG: DNA polymerase IV [Candidatus Ordinivivax streblomastigis]|uniref:DNA polymerase IV n=1 Tax=Candidatus Ordinivivax streblomastigis TaxID=2540710 RepID=A0A5M8P0N1_9BACT|nr:MAG: DNA polymerase IV [Candidatus Ordinivivax streblomastigis]
MRKIIHIDMDAFYASVEQRDNEALRGKPVAVGYSEARGVVATASYEARKFGIHSAMPSLTAKNKCSGLIFVPPRFEVYQEVSMQIREIFLEYTDLVEPLSLDEAFMDVTVNHKKNPSASLIAKEIQQKIFEKTGLTASAGVSVNKFLAKIASDWKKPGGFFVIPPQEAEKFVENLKIEKFYGVGKVTAQKMHEHHIFTGYDLKQRSEKELVKLFGKAGHSLYFNARGIDDREVEPNRITKSISTETTFLQDKDNRILLTVELYHLAKEVLERMKEENFFGRTITIKVKYADFKQITKSKTLPQKITDFRQFWPAAREMMKQIDLSGQPVRLLGLGVSNAGEETEKKYTQLELKLF